MGRGGPFSPALFHPVGRALPHTSTPQDSPHNPAPKDIQTRYILTGKFEFNTQRQCRTETASGLWMLTHTTANYLCSSFVPFSRSVYYCVYLLHCPCFSTNSGSNKGQRNYYRYVRNRFHCLIWSELLFVQSMSCPCICHVTLLYLPRPPCDSPHLSCTETSVISDADDTESSWILGGLQSMQSWWMQTPGQNVLSPIWSFFNKAASMMKSVCV